MLMVLMIAKIVVPKCVMIPSVEQGGVMAVVTNNRRGHFLAGGERGESMSPAGRYPMNTTIAAAGNTIAAIPAIIIIVIATVTATAINIVRHHHRIVPAIVQRLQCGTGAHGQELLLLLEYDSLRVGFRTGYRSTLSHGSLFSPVLCCLISSRFSKFNNNNNNIISINYWR